MRRSAYAGVLIVVAIGLGVALHYGDDLPLLSDLASSAPWLFVHTTHLPFAILPVAYAAWVFGLRGGLLTLAATLGLLTVHLFLDPEGSQQTLLGLHLATTAVSAGIATVAVSRWHQERLARERDECLLATSEQKYRALVEHNSAAIFLVDAQGNYLEVNPRACQLTGYSREELLRMNVRQLIRPDDAPRALAQALSQGHATRESVFVRRDGGEFQGEITIGTFELDGQPVALGILQDVTETRRLQLEIRAYADALQEGYRQHLHSLGLALDARNPYTRGHAHRVREFAVAVGQHMGLPVERTRVLGLAAELHDYGKIGIPDAILLKSGPLTPAEWAEVRRHPELSAGLIEHIPFLRDAIPILRAHHEKLDGSGYPDGLRGEDIPLEARIISVVDAYDALTSDRPYRKALTDEQAWAILEQESGTKWDPRVLQAFRETVQAWIGCESKMLPTGSAG